MKPSDWIIRFSHHINRHSQVLDLACGTGRHGRHCLEKGATVTFLDQNLEKVEDLRHHACAKLIQHDLETGKKWPFQDASFDAIIVTNYLFRPAYPFLLKSLKPEGFLLYETFAVGQEKKGRPKNPDFLLKSHELLEQFKDDLQIIAFEQGDLKGDKIVQRICCVKSEHIQFLK